MNWKFTPFAKWENGFFFNAMTFTLRESEKSLQNEDPFRSSNLCDIIKFLITLQWYFN